MGFFDVLHLFLRDILIQLSLANSNYKGRKGYLRCIENWWGWRNTREQLIPQGINFWVDKDSINAKERTYKKTIHIYLQKRINCNGQHQADLSFKLVVINYLLGDNVRSMKYSWVKTDKYLPPMGNDRNLAFRIRFLMFDIWELLKNTIHLEPLSIFETENLSPITPKREMVKNYGSWSCILPFS